MRAHGGHRMSEGMVADYSAAQIKARLHIREHGITEEDRRAAYKDLCRDRDHCLHMLGA